jgi:hypothetical protein
MWFLILIKNFLSSLFYPKTTREYKNTKKTLDDYFQECLLIYRDRMNELRIKLESFDSLVQQKNLFDQEMHIGKDLRFTLIRIFGEERASDANAIAQKLYNYRSTRIFKDKTASDELYDLLIINKNRIKSHNDKITLNSWSKDFEPRLRMSKTSNDYESGLRSFQMLLNDMLFYMDSVEDFEEYFEHVKKLIDLNSFSLKIYQHFYREERDKNERLEDDLRDSLKTGNKISFNQIQHLKSEISKLKDEITTLREKNEKKDNQTKQLETQIGVKDRELAELIKSSDKSDLIRSYSDEIDGLKNKIRMKDRELDAAKDSNRENGQIEQRFENEIEKLNKIIRDKEREINSLKLDVSNLRSQITDLKVKKSEVLINKFESPRSASTFTSPPITPTAPNNHSSDTLTNYVYVSRGSCNNKPICKGPGGGLYYINSSGHKQYVKEDQIRLKD